MKMDKSAIFVCGAACALAAASAAAEVPDYLLLDRAMRGFQSGVQTDAVFGSYYGDLYGASPSAARNFAVMFFWHASGDIRASLYAPSGQGQGNPPPPRGGGPVERLSITEFRLGTTSFLFKVEWPLTQEFPLGTLDFLTTPDLTLLEYGWSHLGDIPVIPSQGYADIEILFEDLPPLYMEDLEFFQRGFFMFRVSEPGEEWLGGGGGGDKDDDGDPPGNLDPKAVIGGDSVFLLPTIGPDGLISDNSVTCTFDATPGEQYLIAVDAWIFDMQSMTMPWALENNTVMSWDITAPDGQTMTGSIDALGAWLRYQENGPADIRRDFILFTAPEPPPGPTLLAASGTAQTTVRLDLQETPRFINFPGMMKATQIHITLEQYNMPNMDLPAIGSTDLLNRSNAVISAGGTAYITGDPHPPVLSARVRGEDNSAPALVGQARWRLRIETERGKRGTRDNRTYPAGGGFTPFANQFHIAVNNLHNPLHETLMNGELIGGKCFLDYEIKGDFIERTVSGTFPFFIRGLNPADGYARAYINSAVDKTFKPYAWAIFKHETRDGAYVYNQFNPKGTYMCMPNWGDPDGWGICQIDRSGNKPKGFTTTEEVYNWKTNVLSGNLVLREKLKIHKEMLRKIKRSYPNHWVEPPATVMFSNKVWNAEQLAVTVLYNGAAGVETTLVKTNEALNLWAPIQSPLVFDYKAAATNRWSFSDNRTNYAYKVSLEFDPQTQPPAVE
ncbi:MAG: hypothetical protein FWG50_10810 [Kiritimatiellaeota bacterium]|nr:hypothetical protein [Kiritimatiellota bacterium]